MYIYIFIESEIERESSITLFWVHNIVNPFLFIVKFHVCQTHLLKILANNCLINVGSLWHCNTFFLHPYIFFNLHAMLINAYTKEFTLMNLVTFSISRSYIRMKFYFVYSLIRPLTKCVWMNCSKILGCYMSLYM